MKFSFNAKPKPKPGQKPAARPPIAATSSAAKPSTPLNGLKNGIKRQRTALHDSDDEDGAEGAHEEISHFDQAAGGAVTTAPRQTKAPLVIPAAAPSRAARVLYRGGKRARQKSGLPAEEGEVDIKKAEEQVGFGLTVREKKAADEQDRAARDADAEAAAPAAPPPSEDDAALSALLGGRADGAKTIPVVPSEPLGEDELFRRDYAEAQDAPTLADYLAVPADDFGAACLRGMGWRDTETIHGDAAPDGAKKKPRTFERRPALLGVGAKPSAALGVELGEWGGNRKGKGAKVEAFNPLVLQNKKTGEKLTEQELKDKIDGQSKTRALGRYV
jgi:G-patch domain